MATLLMKPKFERATKNPHKFLMLKSKRKTAMSHTEPCFESQAGKNENVSVAPG